MSARSLLRGGPPTLLVLVLGLVRGVAAAAAPPAARLLTLAAAEAAARADQPSVRVARAGTLAAQARAGSGRAGLLPQLSASAGYARATGNVLPRGARFAAVADNTFDNYNNLSGSITASQLLWDFGQTTGRAASAEALVVAAEASERTAAQAVLFGVRSAFFDARQAKALLSVAVETLQNQQKHREQTEAFVKSGTRPDIDLAQARTDEANANLALVNATNTYETARQTLNLAMGVEGSTDYEVADDEAPGVPGEEQPLQPLLDEALKARPEQATLEAQVKAQRQTLRSIEGQYWPSISANAGFTQGGNAVDNIGWNLSIGATASWQLFQGFATRSQAREAEANLASFAAQADLLRQQIRADVDAARLAIRAAGSSRTAAKEALQNARERLRLAEERYQQGVGNAIELGDAQLALTLAESQSVQADYRLSSARALLLRALGRP